MPARKKTVAAEPVEDADNRASTVRASVAQATNNNGVINFRLPNPILAVAILFGMWVTIALAAEYARPATGSNWVTQIRNACYFHPYATLVLAWIEKNVVPYVFFGYQRQALIFIAPAAVAAHVVEALVALVKIIQVRGKFGAQVCSVASAALWTFAVFLFGFGSLGLLNKEIRRLTKKQ